VFEFPAHFLVELVLQFLEGVEACLREGFQVLEEGVEFDLIGTEVEHLEANSLHGL